VKSSAAQEISEQLDELFSPCLINVQSRIMIIFLLYLFYSYVNYTITWINVIRSSLFKQKISYLVDVYILQCDGFGLSSADISYGRTMYVRTAVLIMLCIVQKTLS
jgi:hypothetical protein